MKPHDEIAQYHLMHKTVLVSLLALQNPTEDDVTKYSHDDARAYGNFYHYKVDSTKRQKIEQWNRKYRLNAPIHHSFFSLF